MPKSLHLICHQEGTGLRGVRHDKDANLSKSISWDISEHDAKQILGGWVYLHETKRTAARQGGIIRHVIEAGPDYMSHHGRPEYAIFFEPRLEAKGQKWRGKDEMRDWYSGLVDPSLPHELTNK